MNSLEETMSLINRDAMIVFPKQSLYDWQNRIFPEDLISIGTDPFGHEEGHVFLIPQMDDSAHFEKWIKKNYKDFFENLLFEWCTDESLWPSNRTYKMFIEWFHVSYQSMVQDTIGTPIEQDEE